MKIRRIIQTSMLALGLLAATAAVSPVAAVGPTALVDPVTIQLGAQNNSGIAGSATLTDLGNNQTRVVIAVTGFTAGTPSPVHIHEGTCTTLNPAVKFPLTNLVDGKSETTVPVALSAVLAAPHAINAHKSAQEASVYVSCGNVVAASTTGTGGQPATGTTGQQPTAAPRTGGGGMSSDNTASMLLAALAALLTLGVAGTTGLLRRRSR